MIKKALLLILITIAAGYIKVAPASAHQPRIVEGRQTIVTDPEVSKAYYGTLSGSAHTYTIESKEKFDLYVGILVPDTKNSKKDVTAKVYKEDELLATIGGEKANWKKFFEPFGQSTYWDGGEYRAKAEAGTYSIIVSSVNNDSKYSLAIGEIEAFDRKEGLNALNLIPGLKRQFFEESPISFIKSPFGWAYILILYIFASVAGLLYHFVLQKVAKGSLLEKTKNIGSKGRIVWLAIWLALLLWAITTSWNAWLIFFSGIALFEALINWRPTKAAKASTKK